MFFRVQARPHVVLFAAVSFSLTNQRVGRPLSNGIGRWFLRGAALLACLGLGVASANAQICTVSSTSDTNTSGTLRYCLNNLATGSAASTNTISFSVTGKIQLTSSLPDVENGITINGPGADKLTISGNGQYQVFIIGQSSSPSAVISGVKISGGMVTGNGAAIDQPHGSLTISNCEFANNSAGVNGGAIFGSI